MIDRIDALHGGGLLVVDQDAEVFLLIRFDLENDQAADDREEDFGIIERLVGIVDRLLVDPLPGRGVVLDLDCEVTAGRLDENPVIDPSWSLT